MAGLVWYQLGTAVIRLAWLGWAELYWVGLSRAHIVWARLGSGGVNSAEMNSAGLVWYQLDSAVLRWAWLE